MRPTIPPTPRFSGVVLSARPDFLNPERLPEERFELDKNRGAEYQNWAIDIEPRSAKKQVSRKPLKADEIRIRMNGEEETLGFDPAVARMTRRFDDTQRRHEKAGGTHVATRKLTTTDRRNLASALARVGEHLQGSPFLQDLAGKLEQLVRNAPEAAGAASWESPEKHVWFLRGESPSGRRVIEDGKVVGSDWR